MKKPLQTQECARILKMREKGMSIAKICKELHRSKPLVSAFIKDKNLFNLKSEKSIGTNNGSSSNLLPYEVLDEASSASPSPSPVPKKKHSTTTAAVRAKKSTNAAAGAAEISSTSQKEKVPKQVSLEHRCVIKYLTEKGWNPDAIYDDMKRVYKSSTPNLKSIEFWVNELKLNPSICFDKDEKQKQVKPPKKQKIWVSRDSIKIPKNLNIKRMQQLYKKKEKGKEKTKTSSNKNLITFKLFDEPSKNRVSS